jgi:hypothetical protein
MDASHPGIRRSDLWQALDLFQQVGELALPLVREKQIVEGAKAATLVGVRDQLTVTKDLVE